MIKPEPARTSAAVDGGLRIRGRNILDMRMARNDLQAATIREYLCELVKIAFVTADAHYDLAEPLIRMGMINGSISDDGDVTGYDPKVATDLIWEAIEVLSAEPFRPIGIKTDTQRRTAQLQRRYGGKARR